MYILSISLVSMSLFTAINAYCDEPNEKPIAKSEAVIAIYTENMSNAIRDLEKDPITKLIVAVWGDGRIIWSQNRISGGAPYYSGNIEPKEIQSLLAKLKRDGYF
jgi:hypothetical protein